VLLALAFPRMVPPRGVASRRKREAERVRPAEGSAFCALTLIMSGVALTVSSGFPSNARYTASPSAFGHAHRPGAQRLRAAAFRVRPVMQELARRFTEGGRADRVAFFSRQLRMHFFRFSPGADAGADRVSLLGLGLGSAQPLTTC